MLLVIYTLEYDNCGSHDKPVEFVIPPPCQNASLYFLYCSFAQRAKTEHREHAVRQSLEVTLLVGVSESSCYRYHRWT